MDRDRRFHAVEAEAVIGAIESGGTTMPAVQGRRSRSGAARRGGSAGVALLLALLGSGCAAVTNPVAEGVPVRKIPDELLVTARKDANCTIPLHLLSQPRPNAYRLAPGDVLAVFVDGFLGTAGQNIPVNIPTLSLSREQRRDPASTGYPIQVREDGTIYLPVAGSLYVQGMTIPEAQQAVRRHYIARSLLREENANVLVSLLQPRQYSVVVLRQEAASFSYGPNGLFAAGRRGTGWEIDLPAYENDVLHALARTGGLPGLDACNEIIIQKRCFVTPTDRAALLAALGKVPAQANPLQFLGLPGAVIRIPLRTPPGHPPAVRPEDVILESGDIVFIEAAEHNIFYAGGLLPPGEYQLPRDRDFDVLEAVAFVRGPLINGSFGGSNLSGALVQQGIGYPSATHLTVVRRTPNGGQVPIVVDLAVALTDNRERILVKPGDVLILQEKPDEAFGRYLTQTLANFTLVWDVVHTKYAAGILDVSAPDRLPRIPNVNFLKQ